MTEDQNSATVTAVAAPRATVTIDDLFHPRSIAVVGASSRPDGRGNDFLKGMLEQGFPGPLYPVNPKADVILDMKAYPDLLSIPGHLDYVISSIPAAGVPDLLRQAGQKGVRLVHLFTAGFGETGFSDRAGLEQEILQIAREGNVRLLGPNCMGLYCADGRIAWSSSHPKQSGSVMMISQSGANADATIQGAALRGLRFSKVASFGNGLDLNEADLLAYAADDPATKVIGMYLEGVKNGRRFRQVLEYAASRKPVAILKGGRTEAGGRATLSHTGSLAGNSQMWDVLCRQTGAQRAFGLDELVDTLTAFNYLEQPPAGPRVAIIGGGGGHSVLAADDCAAAGLSMPWFSTSVQDKLREFVPVAGTSVRNPLDTGAVLETEENFTRTVRAIGESGELDFFMVHVGGFTRDRDRDRMMRQASILVAGKQATSLPMVLVVRGSGIAANSSTQEFVDYCSGAGLPVFPSVTQAAAAVQRVRSYYAGLSAPGR